MNNTNFCFLVDLSCIPNISASGKWAQNGITLAGGNGQGSGLNQLCYPVGLDVDDDQTVYVADHLNHRVVEWKSGATSGQIVAGGNSQGNRTDQLNSPRDVIVEKENNSLIICDYSNQRVVRWPRRNGISGETIISDINCGGLTIDNDGSLYVSDWSKHEVRQWRIGDANGTVVAGGDGPGNRLDQLNYPTYIFVDHDHSVYVSDGSNHRVMKWMKGARTGIVVAGGQGQGNGLTQLSNPRGVVVDQLGTLYVVDCSNHRVMRWLKGATQGSVIVGGNGQGGGPSQFYSPVGLSFDRQGNLYVVDYYNHRLQKFIIDPSSNT
jgi:sugar lactone lactonase YvrE